MTRATRAGALFLVAAVLSVVAIGNAHGGNYANAGAKYFSVDLSAGDYFHSTDGRIVLVDDVNYSVQYSPCAGGPACDYFSTADIPDRQNNWTPPAIGYGFSAWGGTHSWMEAVWSKAHHAAAILEDWNGLTGEQSERDVIDRASWSTYGQLMLRTWTQEFGFVYTLPSEDPTGAGGGAGGDGIGIAHSMPATLAIVETSPTRHFQSPYVVVHGRVYLQDHGATGFASCRAIVKGRTLSATDPNAPAVDANVAVVPGP